MKKLIVLKAVVAVLFLSLFLISCEDDYEPIPVKLEDVNGNYKGKLITSQGNIQSEKIINFTAKKDTVKFAEFPIREIVKTVIQDPVKTEAALVAIGKVKYNLDYTTKINTANNVIELTFAPKTLQFQIPVDGVNKNTVVTIAAKQKGYYVGQDFSLRFGLVAEKIVVDGLIIDPFTTIKYDFPYCIKN
ncbi:DUF4840 domain-containing protein [Chryseobacterium defluvii]|uniref:Uncharacterized protein DUF4840 n=1 Tax=Chryseobacterium defluvii TaxID=160396 RepID=A0A495S9H1_9FLAO|nr:DUF4840 domain-containing protein [Chryseobacterium defluvii]RKS96482.1 uncharacterized protein DUF4840 [Chryseobacterium defluvii]